MTTPTPQTATSSTAEPMANTYVQGHSKLVTASHSFRNAENSCSFFTHLLKPDSRILDAGCGAGYISASLARLVPQGSLIGVDAYPTVIESAQSQEDLPSNCTFQTANILRLPFEDDTFDVVYTSQVLVHLPDVQAAVKELRRVCKSDGGFLALREGDIRSTMLWPMNAGMEKWLNALYASAQGSWLGKVGGRAIVRLALDAGFEKDKIQFTAGTQTFSGNQGRQWSKTMLDRVLGDEVWRGKARDSSQCTDADFEEMADGWRDFIQDDAAVFSMLTPQVVCYK